MPRVKQRSRPLTGEEKGTFFAVHGHLPYRYTMLWTHKKKDVWNNKIGYCHAICAFEASLLACRVFMEFLGLGIKNGKTGPVLIEKHDYHSPDGRTTDEVKVVDLGGSYAKISDLTAEEGKLLATVYHMAHKATAHLTFGAPFMEEASIVHKAIPVLDRLLRKNLYDLVGTEPRGHW